jgi:hypothetical protein
VRTTKPFYISDNLRSVAAIVESFVKRTMVGEALGVDTGHTWELVYHTSDEVEDWSHPKQYLLTVDGYITRRSGSATAEQATGLPSGVLGISVTEVQPGIIEVDVDFDEDDLRECFGRLLVEMGRFWPHITASATEPLSPVALKESRTRGPTIRIQRRAECFKALKEKHPEWSQAKVGGCGEEVTADSVRNAYRAMGWKWQRGDRVR